MATVAGMARTIWSGAISFGLISIPIKLFTAVRHKAVSFNQLDDRTMGRIRYEKVSEADGEPVPAEHIVKGVEISKGRYVIVDPDELAPFVALATKSIDVEQFVDPAEIDPVFFESTYYVAPAATGAKPYALLARALASTGRVAIVRFVMRSRQYTASLRSTNGRLVMSTLAYADEMAPAADVEELEGLDAVEVSDREVKMAEMLVESLTAEFDPTKYEDDYRVQVLDLIAKKAAGEEFELPTSAGEAPRIVDMMEALEASVAAAKEARKRHPTARPAPAAKRPPAKRPARRKTA
jgi:DNA end-binding protein Ku